MEAITFSIITGALTAFGGGTGNGGFSHAGVDAENKDGWNELELITYGDKAIRIVNGKVVMALSNSRYTVNGEAKPLVNGKIQLQCEAAEVFYKDIKIKQIDGIPTQRMLAISIDTNLISTNVHE